MASAARAAEPPERDLAAAAAGARVAGAVIALGYLTGLVEGPIVALVGGLALVTFGRALASRENDDLLAATAFSVLAGAIGIGAFRWGSLDLAAVRGAQSVLGPTVLVGPTRVATAAVLAVIACVLATATWLASTGAGRRVVDPISIGEMTLVVGTVVTVFWGPALSTGSSLLVTGIALWASGIVVAGVVALVASRVLVRARVAWRVVSLVLAGLLVAVAAGLMASVA